MRKFLALTLAVLTLAGCADPESSIVQNANPAKEESPVDSSSDKALDQGPGKPDWELTASPSTAESCKVEDGLPDNVLALGRGSYYEGGQARGPVGFPWVSSYFLPPEGELKFLMVSVSFEDTEKFIEQPSNY